MLSYPKILYAFLFLLCFYSGSSTNFVQNKDSLLTMLQKAKEESVKVSLLRELAEGGTFANRDESIDYYKQILEYDIDVELRGWVLNRIGYFNWQLGNYEKALKRYANAVVIFRELNDSLFLGRIYNNIAVAHWGLGNNSEALSFYQNSLEIRKSVKDSAGVSKVLNNIGKIYQELFLFDEAFNVHNEALSYAITINDSASISYSYANLGDCFEKTHQLDSALHYYTQGYAILLAQDPEDRSNSFFSDRIGLIYSRLNQPDSALHYNQKALAYAKRINNKNRIALAEYHLGKTFLMINETDSAQKYIQKSYNTANEKGYAVLIKDNLFAMAELEEAEGDIENAYQYFKRAVRLNDSIYNDEVVQKVRDLQIKYVTEQKEQENLQLRQHNQIQEITIREQRIITLLMVFVILLTLIVLYFIAKSRKYIQNLNHQLAVSEKHLKKANDNKNRFFTIIAHDLRSPFNGILGITELLDTDFDNLQRENVKELIAMLRKSAYHMFTLLNNLLQWAQTQQDNIEYNFISLDIHYLANNVADTLRASAHAKKITIHQKIKEDTFVYADKDSVRTVLHNLVNNAIKFTPEDGRIEIEATRNDAETIISVHDTGVGMSNENQKRLFQISEKVSESGTNNEKGSGFGLILCKELIKQNNGTIWLKSESGKGSVFYFSLPNAQ